MGIHCNCDNKGTQLGRLVILGKPIVLNLFHLAQIDRDLMGRKPQEVLRKEVGSAPVTLCSFQGRSSHITVPKCFASSFLW